VSQIDILKYQNIQFGKDIYKNSVWQFRAGGLSAKLTKLTKLPNCQTHDSHGFDGIRVKIQFGSLAEMPPA